ncbi:MAG TPA: CopD family protein, partial [Candidatus Thermoplasmatota archaeon]|nr:CopD family protein [Candidatus Thermoplasmatota archaeon]
GKVERGAAERDPAVRGSPLDLASGATFALSLAALLGAPLAGILVWRPQVRAGVDEALARAVERRFLALWIAGFALAAVSAALLGAGAGPPAPGVGGHGGPTTERGTQASLRLALLAYAFAVLGLELGRMALAERRDRLPWTWPVAVGAGLVLAAASALLGHLGAQGWTPALLDLVHTILGTVWIGGVAFLALVVVPAASLLEEATRRGLLASCARAFTPVATSCVAGVVATGVVATLALAGGLEGLTTTAWGWVLLAKVALVAVVLAFGARNRRFGQGRGSGPRSFARAVGAEAALGAAVLVAAGLLTALVPPVSEVAAAPGEPPEYHILRHADDDGVLTVAILPATAGAGATRYDVDVFLSGPLASALPQARVSVDGPDPRDLAPLRSVRPGHARVEAVPLSEGDALAIAIDDRTWRFGRVFD